MAERGSVVRPFLSAWRLGSAYAWRGRWKLDDTVRATLWGRRLGFDLRPRSEAGLEVAEPISVETGRQPSWLAPQPRSAVMGAITSGGLLAEAGGFYGLAVHQAAQDTAATTLEMARRHGWPLVGLDLGGGSRPGAGWAEAAGAYVDAGGTLFVDRIPAGVRQLADLAEACGRALPQIVNLAERPLDVLFESTMPGLTGRLSGVAIRDHQGLSAFGGAEDGEVVAWLRTAGGRHPAVVQTRLGRGRIVLSVGDPTGQTLAGSLMPPKPLAALPAMMLIKETYGDLAWHAPFAMASAVIDDPALRGGRLGLDYGRALAQAREHGFHFVVATIPRELELADPRVVDMLRRSDEWASACYHGSDHSGYEFFLPEGGRMRYRTRPLAEQAAALGRAVERGEAFARRTGLALDRVMVFPFGIGPAQILPSLQNLGFVAACNYDDRYPLSGSMPADFDLGLRPADLGWAGFPLLWRRGLPDRLFVLDLFLGRPAITFGHPKALGADLLPFVQRAGEIRRVGDARWTSLEDIARHSYLERFDPSAGWRVLMHSNEICIHNGSPITRNFIVDRPHVPEGYVLDSTRVRVPPGGCSVVRLTGSRMRTLAPGRRCSFALGQTPNRDAESA